MGMLERRREPSAPAAGVALPMLLRGCCWDGEDASGLVDLAGLEEGLSRTRRRNWSLFMAGEGVEIANWIVGFGKRYLPRRFRNDDAVDSCSQ